MSGNEIENSELKSGAAKTLTELSRVQIITRAQQ